MCSEVYKNLALKQKQIGELLARDVEGPLSKNLETHLTRVQSGEKTSAEALKRISEEIKVLEKKCSKCQSKKKGKESLLDYQKVKDPLPESPFFLNRNFLLSPLSF